MKLSVLGGSKRARKRCRHFRVFLNGVEVTRNCQAADDRLGRVLLFQRDDTGRPILQADQRAVARQWHRGVVRVLRAPRRRSAA